ncbi:MAG: hypothetical protein GXO74_07775 [Calditrichaeota bacterium]|nr:hypothetical protein [Calditrichota bacterium]
MKIKKTTILLLIVMLLLAINTNAVLAQYKTYSGDDEDVTTVQNKSKEGKITKKSIGRFYVIEASRWPKIQFFGVYSAMIVWISFILGLTIFLMARYAGARESKFKIWLSVFTAVFIGTFSRSLNILIRDGLFWLFNLIFSQVTASSIADFLSYVLWLLFTAGVAVHLYEIFTVTAKEVFQNR